MKKHIWDSETECAKFLSNFCEMSGLFKILEVGVWQGATSVYLEKVSSEFIGIDIVNEQIKSELIKSKTLVGDSVEVMKTLESNYFDLIFIDGEHTTSAVVRDFNNYKKFVNSKGYVVFDDYGFLPEVKKAVDSINDPDFIKVGRINLGSKNSNKNSLYLKDGLNSSFIFQKK